MLSFHSTHIFMPKFKCSVSGKQKDFSLGGCFLSQKHTRRFFFIGDTSVYKDIFIVIRMFLWPYLVCKSKLEKQVLSPRNTFCFCFCFFHKEG